MRKTVVKVDDITIDVSCPVGAKVVSLRVDGQPIVMKLRDVMNLNRALVVAAKQMMGEERAFNPGEYMEYGFENNPDPPVISTGVRGTEGGVAPPGERHISEGVAR